MLSLKENTRFRDTVGLPVTERLLGAAAGEKLESVRPSDVDTLLDRSFELALFPLLYQLFDRAGLLGQADTRQRHRWFGHCVQQRVLFEELCKICEVLEQFDFLVLKGLSLGQRLYGRPSWRSTSDLDVLVRLEELDAISEELRKIGFSPGAGTRPEPWVNNEFRLHHDKLPVMVELHWALALPPIPSPSLDEVFTRSTVVRVRNQLDVPVLGIDDGFLQACYHFHNHEGFLKGLVDIASWLDGYEHQLDFAAIEGRAEHLGVIGLVQWPLQALERLTGLAMPARAHLPRLTVDLWTRFTEVSSRGALNSKKSIGGASALAFKTQNILKGHAMVWTMFAALLLDDPAVRFKGLWHHVFLGPESMAQKLGKDHADVETWAKIAGRPAELVYKQLRDLVTD